MIAVKYELHCSEHCSLAAAVSRLTIKFRKTQTGSWFIWINSDLKSNRIAEQKRFDYQIYCLEEALFLISLYDHWLYYAS